MNLYLCGMIGTGKSSIGRALSKRLGWPFFDVDRWMEREAGKKSIRDIVAEEGWVSYREREYKICRRLAKRKRSVVALAGGTVRYAWNMDVLRGTGVFILLKANLTVMVNRAKGNDRPRVNAGTTLRKDLVLLWKKHGHLYHEAANLVYRTDRQKTVWREAGEILETLREREMLPAGTFHRTAARRRAPSE
jgi:shikimate kinase